MPAMPAPTIMPPIGAAQRAGLKATEKPAMVMTTATTSDVAVNPTLYETGTGGL